MIMNLVYGTSDGGGGTVDEIAMFIEGELYKSEYSVSSLCAGAFMRQNVGNITLPNVTSLPDFVFGWAVLSNVSLPNCTTLGSQPFRNCIGSFSLSLPNCTSITQSAFWRCFDMSVLSLPKCTTIATQAFRECSNLRALYIGTSNCTLASSSAFQSCGITLTTGNIYVPSAYVAYYKQSTNWILFSRIIVGY